MDKRWIKLDSISSTNAYISDLISQKDASNELIVIADYQESGRGQGNHSWQSKKGENLLMSMLLLPEFLSASQQFQLSRVASLALCDTLAPLGVDTIIKWPNDILTSLGKIAGILIEHGISGGYISHTILGIGLNLNQSDFPEYPVAATSLFLELGISLEPQKVAETVASHILTRYEKLKEGRSGELERDYLDKMFLINQPGTFSANGVSFRGLIRGVSDFGELQVERDGQLHTYSHGEIIVPGY